MDLEGSKAVGLTNRKCRHCDIQLTTENAAKKNKKYYRNECKPCRSKMAMKYQSDNSEKRKIYINAYVRRIGRVKQYPCEGCQTLCYKKYDKAFCSDKCRFMFYVVVTDECWLWVGAKKRRGYGMLSYNKTKAFSAHRLSYILFKGPIEKDKFICHSCDVPSCVKPAHLWDGSHKDNMRDMIEKGRHHSKLNVNDVYKIRELVEKFGVSQKKIVERFGITSGTVSSIIHRRIWKHV